MMMMRLSRALFVLLGIAVIAILVFLLQQEKIQALESERNRLNKLSQNSSPTQPGPPKGMGNTKGSAASSENGSVNPASRSSSTLDTNPWPAATKEQRQKFLREMRKSIKQEDIGVTTFIPTPEVARALGAFTADELKAMMEDIPGLKYNWSVSQFLASNLMNRLVFLDPEFAVRYGHKHGAPSWSAVTKSGLRRWAKSDPGAALDWLESHEKWDDPEWRDELFAVYARGIAPDDVAGALQIIDGIRPRRDSFNESLTQVSLTAPDIESRSSIMEYLDTLEPEIANPQFGNLVRSVLFREGFEAATAYLADLGEKLSGGPRNEVILLVATEDVTDNSIAKARWLLEQSAPAQRSENLTSFAREWISRDYNSATAWIDSMPAGSDRDVAIEELVRQVSPFDSAGARTWADQIEDEAAKGRALAEVARHFEF